MVYGRVCTVSKEALLREFLAVKLRKQDATASARQFEFRIDSGASLILFHVGFVGGSRDYSVMYGFIGMVILVCPMKE